MSNKNRSAPRTPKPNKTSTALGTVLALLRMGLKLYRAYSRLSWFLGDPVALLSWPAVEVLLLLCQRLGG